MVSASARKHKIGIHCEKANLHRVGATPRRVALILAAVGLRSGQLPGSGLRLLVLFRVLNGGLRFVHKVGVSYQGIGFRTASTGTT